MKHIKSLPEGFLGERNIAVMVPHVREGYDDRERHIAVMLARWGMPYELVLEGDIADLPKYKSFFSGEFPASAMSCTVKHLLAMREIIDRGLDGALILEDDIILRRRFGTYFVQSLDELSRWPSDEPLMISYEDTRLRFVERSRRVKGQCTYVGDRDRMTGAYYVNRAAARVIYDHAVNVGIDRPIDLYHCQLLKDKKITYLWCQPTVATQGSHMGKFHSSIYTARKHYEDLKWRVMKQVRRLVYFLR